MLLSSVVFKHRVAYSHPCFFSSLLSYALHDGSFKLHSKSIHDANQRAQLRIKWAKRFWKSQPLDLVNAYYGERIGVYFAWLGHYTKWLTLPAAVGMGVFVYGVINAARLVLV